MSDPQGYLGAAEATEALQAMMAVTKSVASVVCLGPEAHVHPGSRLLVTEGSVLGTLGSPLSDESALTLVRQLLAGEASAGIHHVVGKDGTEIELYVEVHQPEPELVIVGAGHIAQPLCAVGALLGFRVRVLDDRPEFATRERFPEAREVCKLNLEDPFSDRPLGGHSYLVLVTRGHKFDYECLRRVLSGGSNPAYIGMIGSRRRIRATLTQLKREGFSNDDLRSIHAPLGLHIGAQTPAEIAVSVAAEIIMLRRGGSGQPLRDVARILDRFLGKGEEDS